VSGVARVLARAVRPVAFWCMYAAFRWHWRAPYMVGTRLAAWAAKANPCAPPSAVGAS